MSILKILPNAIDPTANYVFGSVTSNGMDLGAAVTAAFNAANTVSPLDSFARQTANAAFEAANTKLSTSGGTITGNLTVNAITSNTITANGVDLGTAVASAFLLANNASKTTTSDTAPLNPNVGDMWYDTVVNVTLRYTNDGTSNNWVDITGPQNAGYIYQSYSIVSNTNSINETTGNTVIYTVNATNTADNTVLYWTNSGSTVAADFSDGVSNGSVTIINNFGTITRSLVEDLTTETTETIILSLRTGSNTGPVVAVSPTVTIGDTSTTPFTVNYLLVAGGGAGGAQTGGGGGAGGYLTGNTTSLALSTPYTITIGAGGTGQTYSRGLNGANTSISSLFIAVAGGGAGARYNGVGSDGGSGGGAAENGAAFGLGISGQGNNGASGLSALLGGGGGGANAAADGRLGGAGRQWFNGNYYAGGGTGSQGAPEEPGGIGGGGTGNYGEAQPNSAGGVNTGGGGGGVQNPVGGAGGSGIAILRYLGTPVATGGTITQSGGYTYHTFTSSDTFTLS